LSALNHGASRAIGILGGTFDPIHLGHLRLAQEAADALTLSAVRFIPGGMPPHRASPQTPAADRVAMVKLAIAGNPLFMLDERETRRGGKSYTYDTLHELRAELGADRPLVLIMGADAFLGLESWHRWQEIFSLAHIAVAHRPGSVLGVMDLAVAREFAQRSRRDTQAVHRAAAGVIVEVPVTALDISATQVRDLVRARRSARYLLAPAVLDYINSNHLFLTENTTHDAS
jgi:nicotinate-nucleotide adenylyltransferase